MKRKIISLILILIELLYWLPFHGPNPTDLACLNDIYCKIIIPTSITILFQGVPLPHIINLFHSRLKFSNTGKTLGLLGGLIFLLPYFFVPLNKIKPYLETFPFIDQSEIHLFTGIILIAYIILIIFFIMVIYLTVTITQNQIDKHKK
jgi:hypothetical protein